MYCIKRALLSLKNRWKSYALLLAGCFALASALTWKVRLMVLGLFLLVELVLILVPLWLMAKNKPKEILTRGAE